MTSPLLGLATKINKAFGNIFLDCVLTRSTSGSGPAYDPGEPTLTTYNCKALDSSFGAYERGQGLVAATDIMVMILATSLEVKPQSLDRISIPQRNVSAQIVASGTPGAPAVKDNSQGAIWECRCST